VNDGYFVVDEFIVKLMVAWSRINQTYGRLVSY